MSPSISSAILCSSAVTAAESHVQQRKERLDASPQTNEGRLSKPKLFVHFLILLLNLGEALFVPCGLAHLNWPVADVSTMHFCTNKCNYRTYN